MNLAYIKEVETKDLVAFYNLHVESVGGTVVKKFADRKTAEKRVDALVTKLSQSSEFSGINEGMMPAPEGYTGTIVSPEDEDEAEDPSRVVAATNAFAALQTTLSNIKELQEKNGGGPIIAPRPSSRASNSAGVAASWVDSEVRSARLKRDGVQVSLDGAVIAMYGSTREAFRALRLPDNKHIRFRLKLKESHRDNNETATFEHNGKKYVFAIIEGGLEPAEKELNAVTNGGKKIKAD